MVEGVYVVMTNPYLPHCELARICVDMGVSMLQLREKNLTDKELLRLACQLREITYGTKTQLVINDRPDIALLCEADYLHLGQDDLPIEKVRQLTGNKIKIGLSTHNIEQVKKSLDLNPDYIAFGPIFSTNSKKNPDPPTGVGLLRQVLNIANIPVVAIGGIFPENIDQVLETGVRCVAFIRFIAHEKDPRKNIKYIQDLMLKYQ